jgi:hypothetical protein
MLIQCVHGDDTKQPEVDFCLMSGAAPGYDPGVDVMITIFCDFSQFSAKELAFF